MGPAGRNVIERSFNHVKQRRGFAARYDTLATAYRAAIVPNAVITWTKSRVRQGLAGPLTTD